MADPARLVHVYAEVDDARVHEFLAQNLTDFDAFSGAVPDLLSEEAEERSVRFRPARIGRCQR